MRATAPLLEVVGLGTGYGDLRAVWDVSVSVDEGAVTLLLGRNGAGKTTTLLAIAGLLPVIEGSIRYAGAPLDAPSPQRRVASGIALVPEGKRIFHRLSVEDNLLVGGILLRRRERRLELERVYELFPPLRERAAHRADGLSGGQQQMLAIGQALMARPKLLLLDEPSAGLAPLIFSSVIEVIRRLADDGVGVLLVEQVLDVALPVVDGVVLLDRGRDVYTTTNPEPAATRRIVESYLAGEHRGENGAGTRSIAP